MILYKFKNFVSGWVGGDQLFDVKDEGKYEKKCFLPKTHHRKRVLKNRTSLIRVRKKILSDFTVFGVKWSALVRLNARKKLEVKILILTKVMDKMKDSQHPPVNLDFLKIHLSITLARINILTSSFFLLFSLADTLHLTPKTLKSEKKKNLIL